MAEIFKNVYFLYFMILMVSTNVLGYASMQRFDVVVVFTLIALLVRRFTKNMSIVLLSSLLLTNMLVTINPHSLLLNKMNQLCCIGVLESNLENSHPKCLDNIFIYVLPKEILMNGKYGTLVNVKDYKDLAKKIENNINNYKSALMKASKGHASLTRFLADKQCQKYLHIINAL